jgi:hypothetical protein
VIETRLRTKITTQELEHKIGKVLTPSDVNMLLTGPARVLMPDGRPLCIYLPGLLSSSMQTVYPTLRRIKMTTDNRGLASGTQRVNAGGNRTRTMPVMSGIMGSMDAGPGRGYCRLTNYTREHVQEWTAMIPFLQDVAREFHRYIPERYREQQLQANKTEDDWIIPGTPFTTITINNSYSTGVHTDKGDLDEGFSCLVVGRSGNYTGGWLCFPEYRVGVDMRHGDLLLMDAHQWHGNTQMTCECGKVLSRAPCKLCASERVSVVCYYRTKMTRCGTREDENQKRRNSLEGRSPVG